MATATVLHRTITDIRLDLTLEEAAVLRPLLACMSIPNGAAYDMFRELLNAVSAVDVAIYPRFLYREQVLVDNNGTHLHREMVCRVPELLALLT